MSFRAKVLVDFFMCVKELECSQIAISCGDQQRTSSNAISFIQVLILDRNQHLEELEMMFTL